MEYLRISIQTESRAAELLADTLARVTGGCEVRDPSAASELFSPFSPRWDYIDSELLGGAPRGCTVCFYLSADEQGRKVLAEAGELLAEIKREDTAGFYGSLMMDISPMENQDWQNSWKEFFKPTEIGSRLLVRPSWERPAEESGRVELVIDPSSSFGTGTHATTKMCLEQLDAQSLSGANILDMGCGSGILACAALLLGAEHAVCCDIESSSMTATRENIERNDIESARFTAVLGDILTETAAQNAVLKRAPYDFITANIVSDVLIAMAGQLAAMLGAGGKIALSGIIDERAQEVRAAFDRLGLVFEGESRREGWTLLMFSKKSSGKI